MLHAARTHTPRICKAAAAAVALGPPVIASVQVYAVNTPHDWNFYSKANKLNSTLTAVRIRTECGLEGVGGVTSYVNHAADTSTARHVEHQLAPSLVGQDAMMREERWRSLRPDVFPTPPQGHAVLDIALWDLLGKASATPLYKLLGGARETLPVQLSSPMLKTVDDYLGWVDIAMAAGIRAIKLHGFMEPARDIELARAVRRHVPEGTRLVLDAENRYDMQGALKVAQVLDELGFEWLEAPLPDLNLRQYHDLSTRTGVCIVPGGNCITELPAFAGAVAGNSWDAARFDVTGAGGFTQARKFFAVAEAHGLRTEVQSWGHTLTAAANLHLMLGMGAGRFGSTAFELAAIGTDVPLRVVGDGCRCGADVPLRAGRHQHGRAHRCLPASWTTPYEVGMLDTVPISLDDDGMAVVRAPNSEETAVGGLGVRVDWDEMDRICHYRGFVGPAPSAPSHMRPSPVIPVYP